MKWCTLPKAIGSVVIVMSSISTCIVMSSISIIIVMSSILSRKCQEIGGFLVTSGVVSLCMLRLSCVQRMWRMKLVSLLRASCIHTAHMYKIKNPMNSGG